MWRRWRKAHSQSPVSKHPPSSPSSPSNFSFSTFKDIQSLCAKDADPTATLAAATSEPSSAPTPKRASAVFHRVRSVAIAASRFNPRRDPPPPTQQQQQQQQQSPPPRQPQTSPTKSPSKEATPITLPPGAESRIVVYLTSLRVVRPTFEDCRTVQTILRGFRVSVDERDLSMDSGFLVELQRILGHAGKDRIGGEATAAVRLPRVFIGGRYIGGAEEVRQLHEAGELKKFVDGLPAAEPGVCETCGGYRFVLCSECNGSHKCYVEKGGGFRSCTSCNENGLIRCPSCSCGPL